ncbi:MAG: energy transducer TonB [Pseudomonadota bacterium]
MFVPTLFVPNLAVLEGAVPKLAVLKQPALKLPAPKFIVPTLLASKLLLLWLANTVTVVAVIIVFAMDAQATVDNPKVAPGLAGLISYHLPRFPPELVGVKAGDGEVVMVITIDSGGKVNDAFALEATNEAFANSALQAVSDWQFAIMDSSSAASHTWPRREVLQFSFKRSGVVTTLSHVEAAREGFISTNVAQLRTLPWHELDTEPQRLAAAMPVVPRSVLAKLGQQPVMINFVIDRKGEVRVPVITALNDSELMQSILATVRKWRYTPPMYQQKPVAVEVTRALVLPQK